MQSGPFFVGEAVRRSPARIVNPYVGERSARPAKKNVAGVGFPYTRRRNMNTIICQPLEHFS